MKKLAKLCKEYIEQGGEPIVSAAFGLRMAEINMSEVQLYMLENKDASFNELLFMLIDRKMRKPYAMYQLGICYETGRNVPQDIGLAVEWISAAAWAGYAPAVEWMSDMNFDDNAEVQANA